MTSASVQHGLKVLQQPTRQVDLYSKSGDTQLPTSAFYAEYPMKQFEVDEATPRKLETSYREFGEPETLEEIAQKVCCWHAIATLLLHCCRLLPFLLLANSD